MDNSSVIEQTKKWISEIVIGCNFCPFARPVFTRNQIRYSVTNEKEDPSILEQFLLECRLLDKDPGISTSLLIIPHYGDSFLQFWDLVLAAESMLEEEDYEGIYQVASFHPNYQFEGEDPDDPSNYTNRSPFAMLHLLREEELENVLEEFPNPEEIPLRNIEYARKKGTAFFKTVLKK